MEYRVVGGKTHEELEKNVNKLIKDGFKPIGEMIAYFAPPGSDRKNEFLQPMLKGDLPIQK
jgi:hypothetical protein